MIVVGALSAFIGLRAFLIPHHLIDGGVTGVAMLLASVFHLSLPLLLVILNIPFIILGVQRLGLRFGLRCGVSILLFVSLLQLVPMDMVTPDRLLSAIFGGVFLGAGLGLVIRGGAVLDGTEIFALILERQLPFSLGDVILVLNIGIFLSAALFLGVEAALYSILTYWSASRFADFIISGIEEYNGLLIVSEKHEQIRQQIYERFRRGVTVFRGQGGFHRQDIDILFCVITRFELPLMREMLGDIDDQAFFVSYRIDDASGGLTQRRLVSGMPH